MELQKRYRGGSTVILRVIILFILIAGLVQSQAITPMDIVNPISSIVCMFRQALIDIVGALASIIFVKAGLTWIWSQDDPGKRKAAKDSMVHAVVGLVIVGIAGEFVEKFGFLTCT